MRFSTRILLVSFFAAITLCQLEAPAQNKKQLLEENHRLSMTIDSLKILIEGLQAFQNGVFTDPAIEEEVEDEDGLHFNDYKGEPNSEVMLDSMLSLWYIQRHITEVAADSSYDDVIFTSDVSDEDYQKRIEAIGCPFPLPYNEIVKSYIIRYSERSKAWMSQILSLCYYYMPIFEEALERYGLPQELKVLSIIESTLKPRARSRSGAVGLWQFTYRAAQSYGLKVDSYVDERMDPYKSADAAARLLRDNYNLFGDWSLAISAYNCGPGGVRRAIARAGGKTDYWTVYNYLPRETRGYMPAFVGMLYTMHYRKELGIQPQPFVMPAQVDTFLIDRKLHFQQVSEMIGIPIEDLRDLNPEYLRDIIPENNVKHTLRMPYDFANEFVQLQDTIFNYKADELFSPAVIKGMSSGSNGTSSYGAAVPGTGNRIAYKVKNGDTLLMIARRYKVSLSQLKKWNGLRGDVIRAGKVLYIYR